MIYLFTALYAEAQPLIRAMGLRRVRADFGFEQYEKDDLRLVLTGVGMLAAATAVGSVLAGAKDDSLHLINWGSCAGDTKTGTVVLCNKLTDATTGRTYYPDMLYRTDLPERELVTEPIVWRGGGFEGKHAAEEWHGSKRLEQRMILHDMESAAIYAAGSHFLSPDRMHFLKVVTDNGREEIAPEALSHVMEQAVPKLICYMERVRTAFASRPIGAERYRSKDTESGLQEIFADFCCSETMRLTLIQYIRYWELAGLDYRTRLQRMRDAGALPCRDRREGKKRLEQLRDELL